MATIPAVFSPCFYDNIEREDTAFLTPFEELQEDLSSGTARTAISTRGIGDDRMPRKSTTEQVRCLMASIEWQTALGYAEDSSISTRKPILFFFFNPDCIGCQQMDAVTYASQQVIDFINENLIPLRIEWEKRDSYEKYHAIWTPTFFVLDHHGYEVQRTVGFLEPEKFMALMELGIAKVYMTTGEYGAAAVHFKRLIERFPKSSAVPEAIYFRGVTLYKQHDDPAQLKLAYELLSKNYAENTWAKRAAPYRLIKT